MVRNRSDHASNQRSSLPEVIEEDILSRLPVKCLARFRCVSKRWCSLLTSDSAFIQKHLTLSLQNDNCILRIDQDFYTISNCAFESPVPLVFPTLDHFIILGSSSGLICVSSGYQSQVIHIWNPAIRHHTRLPPPLYKRKHVFLVRVCFGFHPISKEYKVVRILQFKKHLLAEGGRIEVEIYSMSTGCWRKLGVFSYCLIGYCTTVIIDGILYGLACAGTDLAKFRGDYYYLSDEKFILSFDIAHEVFRKVPLPEITDLMSIFGLHIQTLGGCLGLLVKRRNGVDVWVMNTNNTQESWTKLFSMEPTIVNHSFHRLSMELLKNGDYLICKSPGGSCSYNSESKTFKPLRLGSGLEYSCVAAVPYVESLVPVIVANNQGLRKQKKNKRKAQGD